VLPNGFPVFDGFFPSGAPGNALVGDDVRVVQVVSEGDVADPHFGLRRGWEGRRYRRDDSDEPGGRFRLYELAGVSRMGTRYPPQSDPKYWRGMKGAGSVAGGIGASGPMNSLSHFELLQMALDHLGAG
jgi:hypothetical protein